MINSYSKIYALGHRETKELFNDKVYIQEKVDGSQISFGVIEGKLIVRSRNKEIDLDCPNNMFSKGVEVIKSIEHKLTPNWIYRGEYLQKPKHNCLTYERTPKNFIILYDIDESNQEYLSYDDMKEEAYRLDFEVVPLLYLGNIDDMDMLNKIIDTTSILGNIKIEGIVVKNYDKYGNDKKVLMGKFVSKDFKEKHVKEWSKANPTKKDILFQIISAYKTEARWNKSIQHCKEDGLINDEPKDIGLLLKEINNDFLAECKEEVSEILFNHFKRNILKGITNGFPQYYKEKIANKQFNN